MKIYIAGIGYRDSNGCKILSVNKNKDNAIAKIKEKVNKIYSPEIIAELTKEYGGDLDKGEFNSEDESYYVVEKELEE